MRIHALLAALLAALTIASLLGACTDDQSGEGDPATESADAGPKPLPTGVAIHYGHGGVGPEGMWGDMTHEETIAMYREAGLTVSHSADWPGSFDDLRLVMLPAPGFKSKDARFTSAEVAQLKEFMEKGGVVVVEAENSAVLDFGCINKLFADLGFASRLEGGWTGGTFSRITAHLFTEGVVGVGTASSGRVALNGETCVVATDSACLVAVKAYGTGWLALLADGNAISDLANWDKQELDNRRLIRNFARLPAPAGQ